MKQYKIAIVAPVHIQPSEKWVQALEAVSRSKQNVEIIIVDDSNGIVKLPSDWQVYDYAKQLEVLGPDLYKQFERFHKSSSCKNFGHWIAYQQEFDIIIGLDSDCIVSPNFIGNHIEGLLQVNSGWTNNIKKTGLFPRGFPYSERNSCRTVLNLGLWENVLDLYGSDRVGMLPIKVEGEHPLHVLSHEVADGIVALSGMNWACWRDALPGFFLTPNFGYNHHNTTTHEIESIQFLRHDDIWGGYIFQKIMFKLHDRISFGDPVVFHDTPIDAQSDANEEKGAIDFSQHFYTMINSIFDRVEGNTYQECFKNFVSIFSEQCKDTEFQELIEPLNFWVNLFYYDTSINNSSNTQ